MAQFETVKVISIILILLVFFTPLFVTVLSMRKQKKVEVALQQAQSALELSQRQVSSLTANYSPIIDMEQHVEGLLREANAGMASNWREAELKIADAEKLVANTIASSKEEAELLIADVQKQVSNIKRDADVMSAQAAFKLKDANGQAEYIVSQANQQAQNIINVAEKDVEQIKFDSKEANAKANQKLAEAKDKAFDLTQDARSEAGRIVEQAKKHAQEIAGDAFEAKAKADSYESAIKAMKNTIEGYKDDYIIPNHSVLDDLAEEFGFKEAGEQLKQARKRVKEMVKNDHAGDCDYVEEYRKRYAIHFVVDAFNGKTDSALAKVKHDNYGKIKQQIVDAFALVNHNGTPFRNARIHQAFLDARQEELKWAVSTHELRQLELAEQRALSMAQQTRRGHVYVISNIGSFGSFGEGVFKIGMTRRLEPLDRVKELGDASVPFSFDVHAMIYSVDAPMLEKLLHRRFEIEAVNKVNSRKEFFRTTLAEIRQVIDQQNIIDVHWTMKAEATEYRESLAIEKTQQEEIAA
jgi:vacuolar-type H+-ATPase subunit H